MNNRKPIRFVFPDLQRRFVTVALACVGISAVLGVCTAAFALHHLAGRLPTDGDLLLGMMPGILVSCVVIGVVVGVPIFGMLALATTMPLMGALHRMKSFLQATVDGEQVKPCRLRKSDPLQDVCTLLNDATREQRLKNGPVSEPSAEAREQAA